MAKEEFKLFNIIDNHPPEFEKSEKRKILIGFLLFPILIFFISVIIVIRDFNLFSTLFMCLSVWFLANSYKKVKKFKAFVELDRTQLERFTDIEMISDTLRFKRLIIEFTDSSWGLFSIGMKYRFVKKDERIYLNIGIEGVTRPFGFLPFYLNIKTKKQKLFDEIKNTTANIAQPKT